MEQRFAGTLVLIIGCCAAVSPAAAQGRTGWAQTQLSVAAGQATDALGVRSSAVTVAPTLLLRPRSWIAADVGLQGTRFANEQWAATAATSVGVTVPLTTWLALTANGHGAWTTTAYDARYTSVAAVPALEASRGRLVGFAGAQVAHGGSRFSQTTTDSPFPLGTGTQVQSVTSSRTLHGTLYGLGSRFAHEGATGYVGYREERVRVGGQGYVDRTVGANATAPTVAYAASIGTRTADTTKGVFGSGSMTLEVLPGASLQLVAARYPENHVTGMLPGTSFSVGVVLRTGRAPAARPAVPRRAVVRGVRDPAPGVQRLAIKAPQARQVEVAGDWTNWKPVRALRAPDGTWYADVRLPPGRYRYAFIVDGSRWMVPEGVAAVDDGFGGRSAWLAVK